MSDPDEELSTISYKAIGLGVPVVTHSGQQFGVVEHVLQVPELDVFDGIVVYTGTGLSAMHPKNERLARAEMLRLGQARGWIRFVDADQVAAITPAYVKCTFEMDTVANLPVPNGPPGPASRHGAGGPRVLVMAFALRPVVRPVVRAPALDQPAGRRPAAPPVDSSKVTTLTLSP